jgi:hypothetical protein
MRFTTFALLTGVITVVNAHFQVAYPPPRGPFDEDNEVNFCDNYVQAVSNRSEFPLTGGFITLNSEHPSWTFAILISTVQDPTSFNNFTNSSGGQQIVRNFASGSGEGGFCIPLDLNTTDISGVQNGANVTLQYIFNGGDGTLYEVCLRVDWLLSTLIVVCTVLGPDAVEQLYDPIERFMLQCYLD